MNTAMMEDIITGLEPLYLTVGFNGLLEAFDTLLVRSWSNYPHDHGPMQSPFCKEGLIDLEA